MSIFGDRAALLESGLTAGVSGRVRQVVGLVIEGSAMAVPVGAFCRVMTAAGPVEKGAEAQTEGQPETQTETTETPGSTEKSSSEGESEEDSEDDTNKQASECSCGDAHDGMTCEEYAAKKDESKEASAEELEQAREAGAKLAELLQKASGAENPLPSRDEVLADVIKRAESFVVREGCIFKDLTLSFKGLSEFSIFNCKFPCLFC